MRQFSKAHSIFSGFVEDNSGNVATIFALCVLPALCVAGAAIDYSRGLRAKDVLQQALDSAVLGSATGLANPAAILSANLKGVPLKNLQSSFTDNADGSVTGSASAQVDNLFLKLAYTPTSNVAATARAISSHPQKPTTVSFALVSAKGWSWKQVDLYVHPVGAASDKLVASYIYQPVDLTANNMIGAGATTAMFNVNGVMTANAVATPIPLDPNYDNAYLKMTVYDDACGPNQMRNDPSNLMVSCGPMNSLYTKPSPVVFATNDPATSHNLFVNGVHLPDNVVASIPTILPCGQTIEHSWEDTQAPTPLPSPPPSNWATQDIFFNVQSTSCVDMSADGRPRLIQ